MITATMGARPEDGGLASGLVNTTYQVGSAIAAFAIRQRPPVARLASVVL